MIRGFEPRLYQQTILNTAVKSNTLVVLPTGLGKTNIAVLLAANRFANYPKSKVLVLAPTRPLCEQHADSMRKYLNIDPKEVLLFTGNTTPAKRAEQWNAGRVIISTPQGLENDILGGKISLKDVSLLVFDEAHRASGDYSYVFLAKQYHKKADWPRILALTASPGSDREKIKEVCQNLFIEEIESRTFEDPDVKPYINKVDVEWVKLDLPEEMKSIRDYLQDCFNSKLESAKGLGLLFGDVSNYSKGSLLELQRALHAKLAGGERDFDMMKTISLIAEALKVQHALELVETQGIKPLVEYISKLEEEAAKGTVKAVQNLVRDLNFRSASVKVRALAEKGIEHPKLAELKKIVAEELNRKPDSKIIIFNQFRDSSTMIKKMLDEQGVHSRIFFGQAKKKDTGLSQKKQKEIIEDFRENKFNCLIATSVAEEGLDIPQVDIVLFYEPIPSAIRTVQRRGRTGRQDEGRVIVLVTKKTRDETNLYVSMHKEKKMHSLVANMKDDFARSGRHAQANLGEAGSASQAKKDSAKDSAQTKLSSHDSSTDEKPEDGLTIIGDFREKGSPVLKELSERGVTIRLERMEVGDFLLSDRVLVEYKKVPDFVNSILDGRLLAQLRSIKTYERPIVIIEGEEDLYSQRQIHPNAIRGAIATIMVSYGIPIFQTRNHVETVNLFLVIAKREADPSKKDFSMHAAKPLSDKEIQEYIVSAFPGIGGAIAKPILKRFGSVKAFVNATEDELREVDLIGEKKAKRIKDVAEKEYRE